MKKSEDKGTFALLFKYLKGEKFKLFLFIVFTIISYLPDVLCAIIVGKALEALLYKSTYNFIFYIILYDGIYIFSFCVAQSVKDYIYNLLEIKFIRNVTKELYLKYQDLPALAFEEMGVGEFISRLEGDTDRILQILARMTRLVCKCFVSVIVIIISFTISIYIGLEMLIFAFVMGMISKKFFPIIKQTQKEIKKENDMIIKSATENITGIREVKALGIKKVIQEDLNQKIDSVCDKNFKIRNYEIGYYAFNSGIYFLLQFCILLTCGYLFINGHIVYSVFMMIQMFLNRLDSVVESLSGFGVDYNKVKVSLVRINQIINNELYEDEKFGNVSLTSPQGEITFKKVSFKYRDNENNVLNNLNVSFSPGKKIAIVGRSGNGKSTIFNLLSRYFDATEGQILIDGYNINSLTEESLRKTISVIRQSPFIFNKSIIDNFRIVKPDVTLKEIKEVCKKAYLDEYIMSLPKKYKTIIGEGGINLSGGQKQRLAIARTLLLNTKVILFDEATSALDNESQLYIKKTIDSLVKDHTIVIVAHRLSTIIDADEIYLIEKGKLKAKGTHDELLQKSKLYKNLYLNEDIKE